MSRYYRAVAVDYDGTLTETDTPDPEVLAAIRRARQAGFAPTASSDGPSTSAAAGRIQGMLFDRRSARSFVADRRASVHVRHWHKCQSADLPYHQRCFFRRQGRPTGAAAASMADFHHEIARAEPEVLRHHARNRDFSRWTNEVIRDHELAGRLRLAEETFAGSGAAATEEGRHLLLQVIETRYAGG